MNSPIAALLLLQHIDGTFAATDVEPVPLCVEEHVMAGVAAGREAGHHGVPSFASSTTSVGGIAEYRGDNRSGVVQSHRKVRSKSRQSPRRDLLSGYWMSSTAIRRASGTFTITPIGYLGSN